MQESHVRFGFADFRKAVPSAYPALVALGDSAKTGGLGADLIELVKVRASQMNGCAFCTRYHLDEARRLGVSADKLDLVATWRDAGLFDARERAALAFVEVLTQLPTAGVPDAAWQAVREVFTQDEAVGLCITAAAINAWNRLGVGLRFAPIIGQ